MSIALLAGETVNMMWESQKQTHEFASKRWEEAIELENVLQKIANAKDATADELRAMAREGSLWLRRPPQS